MSSSAWDNVRRTYEAHEAALREYHARIDRAIRGDPSAKEGMAEVLATLERKFGEFMSAGRAVSHDGPRLKS